MNWDITAKIRSEDKKNKTPSTAEITVKDVKTNVSIEVYITNLEDLDDSIMDAMDMVKNVLSSLQTGS